MFWKHSLIHVAVNSASTEACNFFYLSEAEKSIHGSLFSLSVDIGGLKPLQLAKGPLRPMQDRVPMAAPPVGPVGLASWLRFCGAPVLLVVLTQPADGSLVDGVLAKARVSPYLGGLFVEQLWAVVNSQDGIAGNATQGAEVEMIAEFGCHPVVATTSIKCTLTGLADVLPFHWHVLAATSK